MREVEKVRAEGMQLSRVLRDAAKGMSPGAILSVCGTNWLGICSMAGIDPIAQLRRMQEAQTRGSTEMLFVPTVAASSDPEQQALELLAQVHQVIDGQPATATMRVLAFCWAQACTAVSLDPVTEMASALGQMAEHQNKHPHH